MEDFPFFQTQDEQFSASGIFFPDEEMDQLSNDSASDMLDTKDDLLLNWPHEDPFAEDIDLKFNTDIPSVESPILNNALTTSVPNKISEIRNWASSAEKIVFPGDVEPLQVSSGIQTDNLLKRITQARSVLINGEKEIFGKNIIGLHSLNEIKTSPDQNYQVTSTVINGKRYKIIIRPKSSGKTDQSAAKRLLEQPCLPTKVEPDDTLITELQNGDYDVLGQSLDVLDPWVLTMKSEDEELEVPDLIPSQPTEPPRVPPLRIKIPKLLKDRKTKHKSKKSQATEEDCATAEPQPILSSGQKEDLYDESGKQIEVPSSEPAMLDHDYCSFGKRRILQQSGQSSLVEKNPRKDSGLESGCASDASDAGSPVPDCLIPEQPEVVKSAPILAQQLTSKLLEERLRTKNHKNVTKMAAALFRAANAATSGQKPVETQSTSNGGSPGCLSPEPCDNPTLIDNTQTSSFNDLVTERPKKKLKLSDYLNRRHNNKDKEKDIQFELKEGSPDEITIKKEESSVPMEINEIKVEPIVSIDLDDVKIENAVMVPVKNEAEEIESPVAEQQQRHSRERMCPAARRQQPRNSSSSSSEGHSYRRRSRRPRGRSHSRGRRRTFWSPTRSSSSDSSSSSSTSSPRHSQSVSNSRYRRRSRSRSRSPPRRSSYENSRSNRRRDSRYRSYGHKYRNRSRSPVYSQRERQRQREERRVVYVGRIPEGTTNHQLRQRFSQYGPIVDISLHFRERADNYGFVTFAYKDDAYQAVEHGNDDPNLPHYDLCFGGRRSFCKQRYSDLDGMPTSLSGFNDAPALRSRGDSFDLLLQKAKEKIHKRKEAV